MRLFLTLINCILTIISLWPKAVLMLSTWPVSIEFGCQELTIGICGDQK